MHEASFADDIDDESDDSSAEANDSDDDAETEKVDRQLYSHPGISRTAGPKDLLPQLAALNIHDQQYWLPKNARTDLHALASPEIFDAVGKLTSCDLTLVDDMKILCKPRTSVDEDAIRHALRRLDTIERALVSVISYTF